MLGPTKLREYKDHLRRLAGIAIKNNSSHPPLEIFNEAIDRVFDYYYKYEEIMKLCMEPDKPVNELDQHKIAAAFFCAIIKAKPIANVYRKNNKSQNIDKISNNEREANNECAYKFGKQIIQDSFYYLSTIVESPEEKAIYDNEIVEPETHDDFYEQWFYRIITKRAAQHLDFESKHFEEEAVFFISHIYFMIEEYSYYFNKAKYLETR